MDKNSLTFLKLGGSLITDKAAPNTARPEVIARLADEIAEARQAQPGLQLLLGHGSGSFGHVAAAEYGTRQGVHNPVDWQGFVAVWRAAAELNRIVLDALAAAGIPAVNFPPSAGAIAEDGQASEWVVGPIRAALAAGLVPVVYGDVVFDRTRGGTILSTEDVFQHLAGALKPARMLIAGVEPGVWADYPENTSIAEKITPASFQDFAAGVRGSAEVDVTGGMRSKVERMLALVRTDPKLQIGIFGGQKTGNVQAALLGKTPGTSIQAE